MTIRVLKKARMAQKERYYKKYSQYSKKNGGKKYQDLDCFCILAQGVSDVKLAKVLGRSLKAIQIKRGRLRRGVTT